MATLVLSAAGAAAGAGIGGSVLGLSGAVVGRAAGAVVGRMIDQRLLGLGGDAVETGRVERFRVTGASEGAPVALQWGRIRVAGQVIWASRFVEDATTSGGGKGTPRPRVTEFSYSVSLALALGQGEILGVGRVWADGEELAQDDLGMRVYTGGEDQLPDPRIAAVEGADAAPAFRGTAYVVIEDLALGRFGNRVPQFSFEVLRAARAPDQGTLADAVRAVALIPGTGEYALATTPVTLRSGPGARTAINVNSPAGGSDLEVSLDALERELPRCGSTVLVVSWFGDDLRMGACNLRPGVEQTVQDGEQMPWRVAGIDRGQAHVVPQIDARPVYGGTPSDASVIEAIAALHARGQDVVFYPFILMEQLAGNGRPDPWTGAPDQPELPWRGRITLSVAPGRDGTPDRSAQAEAEVAAFFGNAEVSDFSVAGTQVTYTGPPDTGLRRMILHYAHLCAAAGGVEAFCIASEMRGLTQVRGAGDSFPAVAALRALAADVRAILGPDTKISYAADWSEYFGYDDGADNRYFHLDPLWADDEIDFIGIDNYMPLSDWRDDDDHRDADWGSIYNLDYLKANVAGGEGYDWFYASPEARAAQRRTPITDDEHGEPWVWRYKDLLNWWRNPHHERIDGVRSETPTAWVPGSKPFWFTELGCAAIDKGSNQPNKFLDPKSAESALPHFSSGRRDDLMQMQYLRAMAEYWDDPAHNPVSDLYAGRMVDTRRAHVWAWDARPFPWFPGNRALWSDGENWARGHWISGRAAAQPLDAVVADICARAGLTQIDVTRLHGVVRGYDVASTETARAALQPLMLAHGVEAAERGGRLRFWMRGTAPVAQLDPDALALPQGQEAALQTQRAPAAETAGRVRLSHVEAEGDYAPRAAEAVFGDETTTTVTQSELPMVLTRAEGRAIAERWLAEARVARDVAQFALPPSIGLEPGDVVRLGGAGGERLYRLDRVEHGAARAVEAVRVEPAIHRPSDATQDPVPQRAFAAPVPVDAFFADLPLMRGDEVEHAPHVAVTATPWPGSAAVYMAAQDHGHELNRVIARRATIGVSETPLLRAASDRWDRGPALRVRMAPGAQLASAARDEVLAGANLMAIGSGDPGTDWELFQFADATLVAPGRYDLTLRLRGRFGTDALLPESWPPGSVVMMVDAALVQLDLPASARGVVKHLRYGPARLPLDDPSYRAHIEAFLGVGLRPYAPVHLRARMRADGGLDLGWVRRTRIDGDSWTGPDVPLGEEVESYLVRVLTQGNMLREQIVDAPQWHYPAQKLTGDGIGAGDALMLEVAQLSRRFGPGPVARMSVQI